LWLRKVGFAYKSGNVPYERLPLKTKYTHQILMCVFLYNINPPPRV